MFKKYLYGGTVRDKLLNIESNDLDYVVVFDEPTDTEQAFESLQKQLKSEGFDLFHVTTDGRYTIRSRYSKTHEQYPGRYADFTLSESNGTTSDLESFLRRCDFTINAIAFGQDGLEQGLYYDMMDGIEDLKHRFLVPCTDNSFTNDPIRIIRYFRFANQFNLNADFNDSISYRMMRMIPVNVFAQLSDNRIKDELFKCFKDPVVGCKVVCDLQLVVPEISDYIFSKFKLRASIIK